MFWKYYLASERCSAEEIAVLLTSGIVVPQTLYYSNYEVTARKRSQMRFELLPFYELDGELYKVTRIALKHVAASPMKMQSTARKAADFYADNSVLSRGRFVKIAITESGIYKLTYEELVRMGFANPQHVQVYGYGGAMLHEDFSKTYLDDLPEVSIYMDKGSDDVFGPSDYILFYGQGIDRWEYNSSLGLFTHTRNVYSNQGYYFVTVGDREGKQIVQAEGVSGTSAGDIRAFDDYLVHERDLRNLIGSGREFYGEEFLTRFSYDFSHSFPNLLSESASIRLDVAARSASLTTFTATINDAVIGSVPVSYYSNYEYAKGGNAVLRFTPQNGNNIALTLRLDNQTVSGWLNYYELNVKRSLNKVSGTPLFFRSKAFLNQGMNHQFVIGDVQQNTLVWDITNPHAVSSVAVANVNEVRFLANTNSIHEYVAVNVGSDKFLSPVVVGEVSTQNLHGLSATDMVIITYADFIDEAERMADAHRAYDGLRVHVVDAEEIYNEFSSGTPDATAYRRFMKMFYDKAERDEDMPRYLLLFGDGSFDNRQILAANTTLPIYRLLTYQSVNSLSTVNSYVTDDYFGFLDDNECVSLQR